MCHQDAEEGDAHTSDALHLPASAAKLASALDFLRRPNIALKTVRPISTSGFPFTGEYLVDERRHQQDDLHQVFVLTQKRLPARLLFLIRQVIRAILASAAAPQPRSSPWPDRPRVGWRLPPAQVRTI